MKVEERLNAIQGICCKNCLRKNHSTANCKKVPEAVIHSTLCDNLTKFWTPEEVLSKVTVKKDVDLCELFYQQSVDRNAEGTYVVSLPLKENKNLGESKARAIQLFYALENKLNRKPQLKETFFKFMNEYLSLDHMKPISVERENEFPNCYIPYHMVQNENFSTTKYRVVFNASSKTSNEISHLNAISIPRVLGVDKGSSIQLHGFCDSSTEAFAAVVYIKNVHNTKVSLVSAKTRVAPIKELTIPKLELCGALLLAELITVIQRILSVPVNELFLWTDSTIGLGWINKPPIKGNIFIKNCVDKILNLTPKEVWYHIPGKLNPADCAKRGLFLEQIKDSVQWWTAPNWIKQEF
ncbi:hypothetical protein AVEN_145910-1 [Araneus ventricosus]|uniref:Peptidase aspartic putative domain-containing protein n=1 Tax=Araneus ventricosus TaxID=182803 RepID=A0A4Y2QRF1_ARAVE|nr:hypothetical protein AVEN_145910-1 [Araneus ventricosus]